MSIFYCNHCDELRDADDGCEEIGGELVCIDCAEALDDADAAPQARTETGGEVGPGTNQDDFANEIAEAEA